MVEDEKTKKKAFKKPTKDTKLHEQIAELQAKLAETQDKVLRAHAEYDNYRKRAFRELSDVRAAVKADTLLPILTVFDHFKMAVSAAENSDDMNVIKEGMKMICAEFSKAMDEFGLEEVNALGEKFDPNLHEAIAKEASEAEEDTVIKQWKSGYKLGNRLLRPATVVVSSGPPEGNE